MWTYVLVRIPPKQEASSSSDLALASLTLYECHWCTKDRRIRSRLVISMVIIMIWKSFYIDPEVRYSKIGDTFGMWIPIYLNTGDREPKKRATKPEA